MKRAETMELKKREERNKHERVHRVNALYNTVS